MATSISKTHQTVDRNQFQANETIVLSVALPKITYGINIWYTSPSKPAGCNKNTGSVTALRNLQGAQRIASLAITGT